MPPRKSIRVIEDNDRATRDNAAINDSLRKIYETPEKTKDKQQFIFADEKKCEQKHPGMPCAANDGPHYPDYLDSKGFTKLCGYCKALLLPSETPSMCCSDGQVRLPAPPAHPKELLCLWNRDVCFTGNESEHFLSRTRIYNNLLAIGYVTSGSAEERPTKCAPIVLINGEIYHYITGNLEVFLKNLPHKFIGCEPLSRDGLRMPRINSQLFWVDPQTANAEREKNPVFKAMDVKENVLKPLDVMLRRDHVLAKVYKTAREKYDEARQEALAHGLQDVAHFRITLLNQKDAPEKIKDRKLHDRQVNLPTVNEIAAIHCSNVEDPPEIKDITLTTRSGQIVKFFNDHALLDPTTYPLIYPYGSLGFHKKIPKFKKGNPSGQTIKYISKRQYFSKFYLFLSVHFSTF